MYSYSEHVSRVRVEDPLEHDDGAESHDDRAEPPESHPQLLRPAHAAFRDVLQIHPAVPVAPGRRELFTRKRGRQAEVPVNTKTRRHHTNCPCGNRNKHSPQPRAG